MRTEIARILQNEAEYIDEVVKVSGWIKNSRSSKSIAFLELNDGTCFPNLQVVVSDTLPNFSDVEKLPLSSAVTVTGLLVATPQAKQKCEIQAQSVEVDGVSRGDYPLQKKRHTFEYLRSLQHLRPRTNTFHCVFRIRSVLSLSLHRFFEERGFVYVHSPIITASDAEGAGEMFLVGTIDPANPPRTEEGEVDYSEDFFGKKTHLTVSGQLQVEAFAMAFGKVYTFGPTFRAENSNTPKHAAEFWMVEPEICFADLDDVMNLAEDMMKYVINYVLKHASPEMNFLNSFVDKTLIERLEKVAASKFVRMSYTEAIDHLKKSKEKFTYPVEWGLDLQTEHERYISEKVVGGPVFITDYPKEIKAFYMRVNDDGKTVAACDLLVPGIGELIGGSQREERIDVLENLMKEKGIDPKEYDWYLDLRRYGSVVHGGFGLGLERALMYMTGMSNIRDVLPYPRTVNSAEF